MSAARSRVAALLLAAAACGPPAERVLRLDGDTMGTTWSVTVVRPPASVDRRALRERIDGVLGAIDRAMSTWDPASELSRFNDGAGEDWFGVSADTLAVVEEALRVHRLTGGAFDVTVGPLVDLWGFGPGGERRRPATAAIDAALARVGSGALETRAAPPAIRRRAPGLRIDLSAVAKGYAVDRVAALVDGVGADGFLVDVGGELRAGGTNPDGGPWRVAVERPRAAELAPPCVLELEDAAVATSGDAHAFFEEDGTRYSHVVDPRTGRPVANDVAAVTVVAGSAMEADALATALMVLGPDEGARLAEREGLAARFLVRAGGGFAEHRTSRFPGGTLP